MRTGLTTACGQRRKATAIGCAEWTPKAPGLVGTGADHPAPQVAADNYRAPTQVRVVVLFHRGVEGVHVGMQDLSVVSVHRRVRHPPA